MAQRIFLIEPKPLQISRNSEDTFAARNEIKPDIENGISNPDRTVRSAGDGMEFENNEASMPRQISPNWQEETVLPKPIAASTPAARKVKQVISSRNAREILGKIKKSQPVTILDEETPPHQNSSTNLYKEIGDLKLKLSNLEEMKDKIIEEKMKVSKQLGIQTQVNSELKTLLVASVGEDLEQRLEKMTLENALTEREAKKLQNRLDEKQEEVESVTIQSDVWRSKFLASRVMADELASWKAVTDSKYRECNAALETLLQEHMQLTTTIASANRFLLKLSEMTGCYAIPDEALQNSSIDLAIANHSLAKRITEKAIHDRLECNGKQQQQQLQQQQQRPQQRQQQISEMYIVADKDKGDDLEKKSTCLSAGEQRAVKAIKEANTGCSQQDKRKKDFLAHNRISQILATRYPLTCLVCKGCKGPLKVL